MKYSEPGDIVEVKLQQNEMYLKCQGFFDNHT